MEPRQIFAIYVRNFIFGVEDSLVSTVGLLSGIATSGIARSTILMTGAILIFVEAFSMAVGSFLSEHSTEEYLNQGEASLGESIQGGIIMFFAYVISGFMVLGPYMFFVVHQALIVSVTLSIVLLFVLGIVSGGMFKVSRIREGLKLALMGGLAIGVGVGIGHLIKQ